MKPTDSSPTASIPVIRVQPSSGWVSLDLRALWEYRELLWFLVWRDLKVRYKQTALGAAWAILQPFLAMVVFSVFFGRLANVPSDGIPYPLFAYCALLPWQLFAHVLTQSADSLVADKQLITKVYFPRLVIPISPVFSGLIDVAIAFIVLLPMMFYYGVFPTIAIVALPLFLLLAMATALAVDLWLSALNVEYRDVRYTVPFLTQLWLFATPIAYPSSLVPEKWQVLYGLNPMAGVVEGFRWALLGTQSSPTPTILASSLAALTILVTGAFYFRRMERTFADVI